MNTIPPPDVGLIQDVLDELNATNEHYCIIMERLQGQPDETWFHRSFPFVPWGTGRVDWTSVPDSLCYQWTEGYTEPARILNEMCRRENLNNPTVVIVWANALCPLLETSLSTVRKHAAIIFAADFDTWIVCRMAGWCVEVYHEGEICFGRSAALQQGTA